MRRIIISINPKHVENIINGIKKYEYRTKAAKEDISSILIYSTSPIMKVVAEVEISEVLEMTPQDLWDKTKEYSGISKMFYDKYFQNRVVAYAYKLGVVKVFKEAKSLQDFGVKYPPQSFVYVK